MKRCRRCHREVKGKETHCTSCGLKLGFNSTYWAGNHNGKGKLPNYGNGSYSAQKKKKSGAGCIVLIFIVFYAVSFFLGMIDGIIESLVDKSYEDFDYTYTLNADEIEEYLYKHHEPHTRRNTDH